MAEKKAYTFVTCLFDLGSRENSTRRSLDEYKKHGEFHFKSPYPIVFVVDRSLADFVWRKRQQNNLLHLTYILAIDLEELPLYQQKDRLDENYAKNSFRDRNLIKDTVFYTMVCWSKISFCIKAAMALNPFKTSHFAWIDFGIAHVAIMPPSLPFTPVEDKIRMVQVNPNTKEEIEDKNMEGYFKEQGFKVAAGFMTGHERYWNQLIPLFEETIETVMSKGWTGLEENVIGWIIGKHPELFSMTYGAYASCIANHGGIRVELNHVIQKLRYIRGEESYEEAYKIGKALEDSLAQKLTHWEPYHCLRLWFEMGIINCCRGNHQARYENNCKFIDACVKNESFAKEFISWDGSLKERVRENDRNCYYRFPPTIPQVALCMVKYDEKKWEERLKPWLGKCFINIYFKEATNNNKEINHKHLYPHNPLLRPHVSPPEVEGCKLIFYDEGAAEAYPSIARLTVASSVDTFERVMQITFGA